MLIGSVWQGNVLILFVRPQGGGIWRRVPRTGPGGASPPVLDRSKGYHPHPPQDQGLICYVAGSTTLVEDSVV